ncbi:MAG: hypothetical protein JWO40_841 [Candidatus Doudnabacteria bacterium]|nr:hypothetical protein [Candidatus Doudnabacteria bacterium]
MILQRRQTCNQQGVELRNRPDKAKDFKGRE